MSMTRIERLAKEEVLTILNEEGYPTYAKLLNQFEFNLTSDPSVVGYMETDKGRIVLNRGLDIEQVSVIARHEILHFYLEHERRLLQKLAQQIGANLDDLDDIKIRDLKKDLYKNSNFNIAADYEISNRGYTDADKDTVRRIKLNGQELSLLVTEDQHPDWGSLSVEEMYDRLNKQMQKDQQDAQQNAQNAPQDDNQEEGQGDDTQGSSSGSSSPQIGDRGDEQIQEAEEAARRAEEIAERSEEKSSGSPSSGSPSHNNSNSSGSEGSKDSYDELAGKANEVGDAAQDLANKIENDKHGEEDKVFKSPEERKKELENEKRLQEIKKMLNNLENKEKILDETQETIRAEQRKKAERNLAQYKASPLNAFKLSLQGFIKNQVSQVRGSSWSKINKTYAHSGIMKPGKTRHTSGKIPLINVYFDQSGSWGPEDITVGEQAIATLNKYVKQGDIQIKLYYFDTKVSGNRADMVNVGTDLDPVITHINATKPDNVIVMTDSDGDYTKYSSSATVPGAVWFLWRNGVSNELKGHLSGKQLTQSFKIN